MGCLVGHGCGTLVGLGVLARKGCPVDGSNEIGFRAEGALVAGWSVGTDTGAAAGSCVGTADGFGSHSLLLQTPCWQSELASHLKPKSQELHASPPQSTSVSVPSRSPFIHVLGVGAAEEGMLVGLGASVGSGTGKVEGLAVGARDGCAVVALGVGLALGHIDGLSEGEARHSSTLLSCFAILLRHSCVQMCI